jgi:hypothetical protein
MTQAHTAPGALKGGLWSRLAAWFERVRNSWVRRRQLVEYLSQLDTGKASGARI